MSLYSVPLGHSQAFFSDSASNEFRAIRDKPSGHWYPSLMAHKDAGVLGDEKAGVTHLLFHVGLKFFVALQNKLVLVAVAREDIRNQRLGIGDQKGILVLPPLNLRKIFL